MKKYTNYNYNMAFRNILGMINDLKIEKLHVRNELQFNETNYEIHHTLDPDTGKYEVKNNVSGTKYLSVNNDGTLNDCIVKQNVTDQVAPISRGLTTANTTLASHTTTLSNHETRITAVEQSGGGGGGSQNLQSVLTQGNDGGSLNILNINNINCAQINGFGVTVDGGEFHVDGTLTANSLYGSTINCDGIGVSGQCSLGSYNGQYKLFVDGTNNVVNTLSGASMQGFSNLDQYTITTGTTTDDTLALVSVISQPDNTVAISEGYYISESSAFKFVVVTSYSNGTTTMLSSTITTQYALGSESLQAIIFSTFIYIQAQNRNSPSNYKIGWIQRSVPIS